MRSNNSQSWLESRNYFTKWGSHRKLDRSRKNFWHKRLAIMLHERQRITMRFFFFLDRQTYLKLEAHKNKTIVLGKRIVHFQSHFLVNFSINPMMILQRPYKISSRTPMPGHRLFCQNSTEIELHGYLRYNHLYRHLMHQ